MHFSFSAVNENANENEIPFSAENNLDLDNSRQEPEAILATRQ